MKPGETYLGDSVYASCEGGTIWLRTGDMIEQRVALEPATLAALDDFRKALAAPKPTTTRLDRMTEVERMYDGTIPPAARRYIETGRWD